MKSPFRLPTVRNELSVAPIVMIDVGAAGGIQQLWRDQESGPFVRYFGFEPHPANFAALRDDTQTRYFQMALSDRAGTLPFHARTTVGSLVPRHDREAIGDSFDLIEVNVSTIKALASSGIVPAPDIIKTDVERHDYAVLVGAADHLDRALCVVSEFEYYRTPGGHNFSAFDQLLTERRMMLFGLAQKNGIVGELAGGDLLYLRDVGSIVGDMIAPPSAKRTRIIKLFVICVMLRQSRYAFVVAKSGADVGLLTHEEFVELSSFLDRLTQLNLVIPRFPSAIRYRIAHALGFFGQLVLGPGSEGKSSPRSNQLVPYRRMFVDGRSIPGSWRRRQRKRFEQAYEHFRKLRGVFYGPG